MTCLTWLLTMQARKHLPDRVNWHVWSPTPRAASQTVTANCWSCLTGTDWTALNSPKLSESR